MDYAFDYYVGNANADADADADARTRFVYDDRRVFSKLYVLFKSIGLVFYTATLTTCDNPVIYSVMNVVMFLSMTNSVRYEYMHHRRYGTTFSSIGEYNRWKQQQWPKTRAVFSMVELGIKTWYVIQTFPPTFQIVTICNVGESVLKIHISFLFMLYFIMIVFSVLFLSTAYCYDTNYYQTYIHPTPQQQCISAPVVFPLNPNEECCICLDIDNIQDWILLPCGHTFHRLCISRWFLRQPTCPVCRVGSV